MVDLTQAGFLALNKWGYRALRPLLFRRPAQQWHDTMQSWLATWDENMAMQRLIRASHNTAFAPQPVNIGGVTLPYPLMLAAGFVKGLGFPDEEMALTASRTKNIIPGWRSMPALVGTVEFGSYTRYPRTGNPGTVIWRHPTTQSTQNRVGLKNPGALAAAAFLGARRDQLPGVFGINIAVSPGVDDPEQELVEVVEAFNAFLKQNIRPTWFTLNISCPNTEDDPGDNQTEGKTRDLCMAVVDLLGETPLWVKLSPDLAPSQYQVLMGVFAQTGVRAVIATNTLPHPAPGDKHLTAGMGGGRLHTDAVNAASLLLQAKRNGDYPVDVIGCGGVNDGESYRAFADLGITTMQYWSALIYRGPFAAPIIMNEAH